MNLPLWIIACSWIAKIILALLVGLSAWSVSIMWDRAKTLKNTLDNDTFEEARKQLVKNERPEIESWIASHPSSLRAGTMRTILELGSKDADSVERAVKSYIAFERTKIEKGFTVLASLASNAPFIGLLGTVLGILAAFGALANGQGDTAGVMSGISEALVATAVGLFVAIPAGIAFNLFSRKLRVGVTECESLKDLFLSRTGGGK